MDPEAAAFLNVIALIVGIFLTLRAVVRMDRLHMLRVIVLTVILTCVAFYMYAQLDAAFWHSPFTPDCEPVSEVMF
jgi:lysylphosphatidylglycerol synthetase-like protein (DUF2156 family)